MASAALRFRIMEIDAFERPLRYRLPFRFGAATVTEGTQAFVRVRIETADGREAEGASAELMVPKWFDKRPALSNDDNVEQLRTSLRIARAAYLSERVPRTAFGHFAAQLRPCMIEGQRRGLPALASAFGPSELDKAVLDALCRMLGASFFAAVRDNAIGFAPAVVADDLAGVDAEAFVATLTAGESIAVRHTVGLADTLAGRPDTVGDGLPESLEDAIARYGLRWFKLKLAGHPAADLDRLAAIARVLDRLPAYDITLDGNEQFESVDAVADLLHRLRRAPDLGRLSGSVAFIEQPLPRQITFASNVGALEPTPALIDEADATLDAFPRARACGYTGVSSKSCKGLYKSLINRLRCALWNREASVRPYFLSAEDLTTPAGLALQQDLALATLLGLSHVERNGHHYVNGMASAPADEQAAFVAAHPDLYEHSHGVVRVAIHGGMLALGSLAKPGFASAAMPDWSALAPLRSASRDAPMDPPSSAAAIRNPAT